MVNVILRFTLIPPYSKSVARLVASFGFLGSVFIQLHLVQRQESCVTLLMDKVLGIVANMISLPHLGQFMVIPPC